MTTWHSEHQGHCQSESCPSDLALDQLELGELATSETRGVRNQIAACTGCQERMARVQAGLKAFPTLDTAALVARIHQGSAEVRLDEPLGLWNRLLTLLRTPSGIGTTAAIATALIFMVIQPPSVTSEHPAGEEIDTVRLKGGESWIVYREHDGSIDTLSPDSPVHPGDRLRFELRGFADGHIVVFGAEASGKPYPIYPMRLGSSAPHQSSRTGPLPGAVALDSSLGHEWLYLVHCPQSFSMNEVHLEVPTVSAPTGCAVVSLALNKVME